MLQMNKHYETEFKKKIVRLHLEEGRTLFQLEDKQVKNPRILVSTDVANIYNNYFQ